jgi:hypothetical protein
VTLYIYGFINATFKKVIADGEDGIQIRMAVAHIQSEQSRITDKEWSFITRNRKFKYLGTTATNQIYGR